MAAVFDYLLVYGFTLAVGLVLIAAATRPLLISADATFGAVRGMSVELRWWQLGMGYIRGKDRPFRFLLFSGEIPFQASESPETDGGELPEAAGKPAVLPIILKIHAVWPYISHFLSQVWHSLSLDRLEIAGTVGTGDPALTATIFGWCWAIRGMLWPNKTVRIAIAADFEEKRLEGSVSATVKLRYPSVILVRAVALIRHPEVRTLLRSMQEKRSA